MSEEYFIEVDNKTQVIKVQHIIFNNMHPFGFERTVTSLSYANHISFKEAKRICKKLVKFFNSSFFRKMRPVYEY